MQPKYFAGSYKNVLATNAKFDMTKLTRFASDLSKQYKQVEKIVKAIKPAPKPKPAALRAPKVKTKRYLTEAKHSVLVKPKKTRRPSEYNVKGSVIKIENGGVHDVSTINANYIGHSIATNQVWRSVTRAIVKALYIQAGITFTNWNDGAPYSGKIGTYYVSNPSSATSISGFETTVTSGDTYIAIADALLASWRSAFSGSIYHEFVRFYLTDESNTVSVQVAQIMAKHFYIDFSMSSRLAVQNRTLSQSGDDVDTDITNNPLIGKVYGVTKHWANYIEPNDRTSGDMVGKFVADANNGTLLIKSSDTNSLQMKKPPPAWFFGMKKETKIVCKPGEILNNYLTFKANMSLNTFAKKLMVTIADSSTKNSEFGTVQMFGLEKLLDSQRTSGSGTTISLGYEINQTYSASGIYKKYVPSSPILEIGTTQVTSS